MAGSSLDITMRDDDARIKHEPVHSIVWCFPSNSALMYVKNCFLMNRWARFILFHLFILACERFFFYALHWMFHWNFLGKKIQVTPETPSGIPLQFSSEINLKVVLKVFIGNFSIDFSGLLILYLFFSKKSTSFRLGISLVIYFYSALLHSA